MKKEYHPCCNTRFQGEEGDDMSNRVTDLNPSGSLTQCLVDAKISSIKIKKKYIFRWGGLLWNWSDSRSTFFLLFGATGTPVTHCSTRSERRVWWLLNRVLAIIKFTGDFRDRALQVQMLLVSMICGDKVQLIWENVFTSLYQYDPHDRRSVRSLLLNQMWVHIFCMFQLSAQGGIGRHTSPRIDSPAWLKSDSILHFEFR
jgi:hypothetical protein